MPRRGGCTSVSLSQCPYSNHWRWVILGLVWNKPHLTQFRPPHPHALILKSLKFSRKYKNVIDESEMSWIDFGGICNIFDAFFLQYCHFPLNVCLLSFQATERMKLVDVLGAKQFTDAERIITQVRDAFIRCSFTLQRWRSLHSYRACIYISVFSFSSGRQSWLFLHCRVWGGQDHDEE